MAERVRTDDGGTALSVPDQIREKLNAVTAEADPELHALAKGDYASYEAAGKLALAPGIVMVSCPKHQTYHLYERQAWQMWLDVEELSLLTWLNSLPGGATQKRQQAIRFGIKQLRLAHVRRELPFYRWQRTRAPKPAAERPYGMLPNEYAKLTRVKLLLQSEAIPDELLVEFQQCARKRRFLTMSEAEAFRAAKIKGGLKQVSEQEPYPCPYCGGLHLGKPRNDGSSKFYTQNQLAAAKRSWNTFHEQANRFVADNKLGR